MPPLPALRAFAAFVEHGSVVAAGDALNVSHAAVSQQLRGLERHLGVALFDRGGRALVLTADGRRLADVLVPGFAAMAAVVAELTGADAARALHVSTTPTFAAAWLMPRLAGFRDAHPEIDIMIDPTPRLADLTPGGVDMAIRYGHGDWPGLEAEMLLASPMVVVAAPSLIAGRKVDAPEDLLSLPWLEELGTSEATRWLASQGVAAAARRRVEVPGNLVLDGARNGQGVAVTVRAFVAADLDAGRLVELHRQDDGAGYYIVTRPGVQRAPLRAFAAWLRRQRRSAEKDT